MPNEVLMRYNTVSVYEIVGCVRRRYNGGNGKNKANVGKVDMD